MYDSNDLTHIRKKLYERLRKWATQAKTLEELEYYMNVTLEALETTEKLQENLNEKD